MHWLAVLDVQTRGLAALVDSARAATLEQLEEAASTVHFDKPAIKHI